MKFNVIAMRVVAENTAVAEDKHSHGAPNQPLRTDGHAHGHGRHRLEIEAGVPVYQNLNDPQMKTDWAVAVGWQYAL